MKLSKRISRIRELIESNADRELLEAERDDLDVEKEDFNQACRAYEEIFESSRDRDDAYRWYDVRDREYTECRMRTAEYLHALDKKSFEVKSVKSSCSGKSHSTASTRLSRSSARSRLIEAGTKTPRLEVEMKLLEEEAEVRRLQLRKELALANAEEETIKKILDEEVVMSQDKGPITFQRPPCL